MPRDPLAIRWQGRVLAAAFALVLSTSGGTLLAATSLGPIVQVSPAVSPFSRCTADGVARQEQADGSTNYPNTEIEPWVEIDPTDPRSLIAAWQQDRWSNGGARGIVTGRSTDGGATWQTVPLPRLTKCTGGRWTRASDPWITYSPNGTVYAMALAFDPDPPTGGFGPNAMTVHRSTDGGRNWTGPIILAKDQRLAFLNDKNSMTADPTNARYVYAVWDRLNDLELARTGVSSPTGAFGFGELDRENADVLAAKRREVIGTPGRRKATTRASAALPPIFRGPTIFTRTTNGGGSWEPVRITYDPGTNNQTLGNQITVLSNGRLLNFFTEIRNFTFEDFAITLRFQRSDDHGATFYPRRQPFAISRMNTFGVYTPNLLEFVRDAAQLFDVAVNPRNGNLYAVWQDYRFRRFVVDGFTLGDEIAFAMSTDQGRTWSVPVRVNQTPANANRFRQQAFIPQVAVGGDGAVVVTYYDFRNDRNTGGELADSWAVLCRPATENCASRGSWGEERRLTANSFDFSKALEAGGRFLGDYMGLAAAGDVAHPVFGIVDRPDGASIVTRRLGLQ